MSRIRIDDSAEYWWSLPCSLLRDSRLSYEARGVACHLLSLGRNWQLRAVALPRVLHDQSRAKGHLGRDMPAPRHGDTTGKPIRPAVGMHCNPSSSRRSAL